MVLNNKDIEQIAHSSDLTQKEESEHIEVDIFLQPYYGTEDSGLTQDHVWIFSQINLEQMASMHRENVQLRHKRE